LELRRRLRPFRRTRAAGGVVELEEQHERPALPAPVRGGGGGGALGGLRGADLDDLGLGLVPHRGEALHEAGGADAREELGRVPPAPKRLRLRLRLRHLLLVLPLGLRLLVFLHRVGLGWNPRRNWLPQAAAAQQPSRGVNGVRRGQAGTAWPENRERKKKKNPSETPEKRLLGLGSRARGETVGKGARGGPRMGTWLKLAVSRPPPGQGAQAQGDPGIAEPERPARTSALGLPASSVRRPAEDSLRWARRTCADDGPGLWGSHARLRRPVGHRTHGAGLISVGGLALAGTGTGSRGSGTGRVGTVRGGRAVPSLLLPAPR